jgi:hypothetical protein
VVCLYLPRKIESQANRERGRAVIRLILLLLGAKPLRTQWWVFIVVSACGLLPSLVFIHDLFDSAIIVTSDIIGVAFVSKA